ncbi:hypothetical protein CSB45_09860 [candidate division KSB3 bacterium]|uniref:Primosomal protein N' (Replication factor Y)-superfamily II helicase n=1 Tax=candidate division KSB3 bacterium TaxID=2044937 RepID=A0A2G6E403_9BACT|nr:MAG: hypothetical protein CSB45_09860 [candidate division KSB3 bacterium]PIE29404.1 MAG: hypothetical protein CSA57_09230 [candidate division KSB3 bacterium]
MAEKIFPCRQCGASVRYKAGTNSLLCPYCGTENEISVDRSIAIEEQDFHEYLRHAASNADTVDHIVVTCQSCGAETTFDDNIVASACPFCGTDIVAQQHSVKKLKPQSLLPFQIDKETSAAQFKHWLASRWFIPDKVKRFARRGGVKGIYSPYWTYDAVTTTDYTGERGEYYYVTERYTAMESGRNVTKERVVRKTRWHPARGTVRNVFNDVIVAGSENIPKKLSDRLVPWDLENLVPYTEEYLSGFLVESYTINVEHGFEDARNKMEPTILATIYEDIGGDEQRITRLNTQYADVTFKHLLLPVWFGAYRFREKVFQYIVNARTGEVQGERPWSWVKITLAALAGLLIAGGIYILQHTVH